MHERLFSFITRFVGWIDKIPAVLLLILIFFPLSSYLLIVKEHSLSDILSDAKDRLLK